MRSTEISDPGVGVKCLDVMEKNLCILNMKSERWPNNPRKPQTRYKIANAFDESETYKSGENPCVHRII